MKIQLHKLFFKLTFWLTLEIIINLLGLDDLANYGEFIFDDKSMNLAQSCGCISSLVAEI